MTSTGARFLAWVKAHTFFLIATIITVAAVLLIIMLASRLYDEKQARLGAIEALAMENRRLAEENAAQDREQCEGINGGNDTLRFLLDGAIRNRAADAPPLSDAARQFTVDIYKRLPATDCTTGAKTYFDPPFPS